MLYYKYSCASDCTKKGWILKMRERASGLLMHISSLPGPYGIGDFGAGAYEFADFLKATGTHYWQILPLGITGYGDSPYQSFSAFAGNPYFIDLDEFIRAGYLTQSDINGADLGQNQEEVDYGKLYRNKMPLLYRAYERAKSPIMKDLTKFVQAEDWLWDFALFMAIKARHDGKSWHQWPMAYKKRDPEVLANFVKANADEIYFWVFTQYFFKKQWTRLKKYCNLAQIKLIGDIPIYVAEDSADVWASPQMYRLDKNLAPVTVAGVPPDLFTADGQLWGNPIYDWPKIKEDQYSWWIKRIWHSFQLYDTVRIDHFRGFQAFWEVAAGQTKAIDGVWSQGPGIELFQKIKEQLGELDILAENLGFLTVQVEELIAQTGFPGMNVMVFAFDAREDSDYLPHNYINNSVVYTSNHDTQTVTGYLKAAPADEVKFAVEYLKLDDTEGMGPGFMRGAWSSVSYLAIAPVQDLLGLDDQARFNIPSTLGNNWVWRMKQGTLDQGVIDRLARLNRTYRR